MAQRKSLEALNRTLQDLHDKTNVMGGVLLMLSGDFRQTPPVISKSTLADEISACLKKSVIWEQVKIIKLTTNTRAQILGDEKAQEFSENLLQIGEGTYAIDENTGEITLTKPFTFKRLQSPAKWAYSTIINKAQGQTLQYCGVDLRSHALHSANYTAHAHE
ncbi:hypothetical protein EVAR_18408_1 [Eumeta japonica]|uniref:ATP-dependent DNA helicase n=1 Tax=Eumeta variegata TaxID=151549 RepID=A0A4C1UU10_EUMVA|nr:hypothetical protein EVAR_18408_1 [Eumeta japonica]